MLTIANFVKSTVRRAYSLLPPLPKASVAEELLTISPLTIPVDQHIPHQRCVMKVEIPVEGIEGEGNDTSCTKWNIKDGSVTNDGLFIPHHPG